MVNDAVEVLLAGATEWIEGATFRHTDDAQLETVLAVLTQAADVELTDVALAALVALRHSMAVQRALYTAILNGRINVVLRVDGEFLYSANPK